MLKVFHFYALGKNDFILQQISTNTIHIYSEEDGEFKRLANINLNGEFTADFIDDDELPDVAGDRYFLINKGLDETTGRINFDTISSLPEDIFNIRNLQFINLDGNFFSNVYSQNLPDFNIEVFQDPDPTALGSNPFFLGEYREKLDLHLDRAYFLDRYRGFATHNFDPTIFIKMLKLQ